MTTQTRNAQSTNPFTFAGDKLANPFATREPAANGPVGYALVQSGPAVDAAEVEDVAVAAVEVKIMWGTNVLHVAHLSPARSFFVGEEQGANVPTDFMVPSEKLGATRAPLVLVRGGQVFAVLLPGSTGTIEIPGKGSMTVAQAIASGVAEPCTTHNGAHQIALSAMARVSISVGDMRFEIASTAAGKRIKRSIIGAASASGLLFAGLSFVAHAALLGGFAMFHPSLDTSDDDEARKEQVVLMQQLLHASADKEQDTKVEDTQTPADSTSGGTGAQAKGESGAMGSTVAAKKDAKWSLAGPKDNPDPRLARERALSDAKDFGIIGLLNNGMLGDTKAMTSPWGRESALGNDEATKNGHMWGASMDDAAGMGGLGLTGVGEGGDGKYEGLGLGQIGFGHGKGLGDQDGFGRSHGKSLPDHVVKQIAVRGGTTVVSGHLPSETIQRIVRQSFGRFRLCYENGLKQNPTLQGRVAVRFVIDRTGAVANTGNGGSDLPDAAVISCVVRAFSGLSFPAPEDGLVKVVYPISFSPGGLA